MFPGSVCSARLSKSSHVFSAAGSSLHTPGRASPQGFRARTKSNRDGPEVIRRVHPDLHHSDEGPDDTPPRFFIVVSVHGVDRAFLSLQLAGQDIDRGLVVLQGKVRILIAQLCEIQVCGGWWYCGCPGMWWYERIKRLRGKVSALEIYTQFERR